MSFRLFSYASIVFLTVLQLSALAQAPVSKDTTSKKKDSLSWFDQFNKKAEHLFTILPVPIVSYSPEAGNTFGLAKFNVLRLSKKDSVSQPSKLSEVFSLSTKGRINASVSTTLVFDQDKYIVVSYVNFRKQPEYIWDIGNTIKEPPEADTINRFVFAGTAMRKIMKNLYVGIAFDVSYYFDIKGDSGSIIESSDAVGLAGGTVIGTGLAAAYDSRDNRYNTFKGSYVIAAAIFYSSSISAYSFSKWSLDARKFFNPYKNYVIALQATTSYANGNVPFYELPQMGGDSQMRGYYQGGLRDNVLVDGQVELRIPVWNIFGLVGWIGTGRVADHYSDLSINGFHLSYGPGLRIKVDSKHNTNFRIDFGFGPSGIQGFYINFGEAF